MPPRNFLTSGCRSGERSPVDDGAKVLCLSHIPPSVVFVPAREPLELHENEHVALFWPTRAGLAQTR